MITTLSVLRLNKWKKMNNKTIPYILSLSISFVTTNKGNKYSNFTIDYISFKPIKYEYKFILVFN